MWNAALLTTLMVAPFVLFYKERPKYYPSKVAKYSKKEERNFMRDFKTMIYNKNFRIFAASFMLLYGQYMTKSAILDNMCDHYGYSTRQTSIIGAIFISTGLIGTIMVGVLLAKCDRYLLIYKSIGLSCLVNTLILFYTLPSRNFTYLVINTVGMGFSFVPTLACGYTLAVELTYPISDSMSTGVITWLAQIFAITFTYVATYFASIDPRWTILLFNCDLAVVVILSFMTVEDLRRLKFANEKEDREVDPIEHEQKEVAAKKAINELYLELDEDEFESPL